jgi:hypothetical protein
MVRRSWVRNGPNEPVAWIEASAETDGRESATRRHAVQQTASYSITSSARSSNDGGTVRPSALAVLRLITSPNLVCA